MNEKEERQLRVIESVKIEENNESDTKIARQTNPILKKLLRFQHERAKKFSVKDLFRK